MTAVASRILPTLSSMCGLASTAIRTAPLRTSRPSPSTKPSQCDDITMSSPSWWCSTPRVIRADFRMPWLCTMVHRGQTPVEGVGSPMSSMKASGDQAAAPSCRRSAPFSMDEPTSASMTVGANDIGMSDHHRFQGGGTAAPYSRFMARADSHFISKSRRYRDHSRRRQLRSRELSPPRSIAPLNGSPGGSSDLSTPSI